MTATLAIDDIVHFGRTFDLKRPMPKDDLRESVRSLFRELDAKRVDYTLVGGVALLSYVAGRNTQDIDLIVRPDEISRALPSAVLRDRDFGGAMHDGVKVDLLLTTNPLFEHVRAHERTTITFEGQTVPCATREGLLLLKLYALPSLYRRGELGRAAIYETDVLMLHQGAGVDDEALLTTMSSYLASHDVSELRRILDEQRARKRFGG